MLAAVTDVLQNLSGLIQEKCMCHRHTVQYLLYSVIQLPRLREAPLSSKHVLPALAQALVFSRQMETEKA